jgi:hypothetical protein
MGFVLLYNLFNQVRRHEGVLVNITFCLDCRVCYRPPCTHELAC